MTNTPCRDFVYWVMIATFFAMCAGQQWSLTEREIRLKTIETLLYERTARFNTMEKLLHEIRSDTKQ